MRIAILGGGFSGLAMAWHLLQNPVEVWLFDPKGIGGGASGMAAGLLHPFAGAHAKLCRRGREGWDATLQLLAVSSKTLGKSISEQTGLLRIAFTDEQKEDFLICSQKHSDVKWLSSEQCLDYVPTTKSLGGILIQTAAVVNTAQYLRGLWQACELRGARLIKEAIVDLQQLKEFDAIVVAMGATANIFPELAHLKIQPVKGQLIELAWPEKMMDLPLPINSQVYLLRHPDKHTYLAGATFEHRFRNSDPDLEIALSEIGPKLYAIMPELEKSALVSCQAGIRASTPNHLPIATRINERCWVLTGMGSKGLLYHSLFASDLCRWILSN